MLNGYKSPCLPQQGYYNSLMNKTMKDNIQEIQKRFAEADKRMHQLEQDIEFFEQFISKYPSAIENINKLEAFYTDQSYLSDKAALEKEKQDNYWSASEDGIWNMTIDFRSTRAKMLKMITDNIVDDTLIIEK